MPQLKKVNRSLYFSKYSLYIGSVFIIAFCSIVYELVFAQALSIVFGSTVMQYSLTIGIYLFFLGVGSFVIGRLMKYDSSSIDNIKVFLIIEILITISAITGLYFIIYLSSLIEYGSWTTVIWQIAGFVPVAFVGLLSGMELPLMTNLYGSDRFAQVLGVDYLGSLIGTVSYALFLFPQFGLLSTVIFVATLNLAVAIMFMYIFYPKNRLLVSVFVIFIMAVLSFYVIAKDKINRYFEKIYLGQSIENIYKEYGIDNTKVFISDVLHTPYQTIVSYDIYFNYDEKSGYYSNKDHCVNLDRHIQACGNWTEAYHKGLIELPVSMMGNRDKLDILVLGGGDFIPVHFLRQFDEQIKTVDLVDIDSKFQNFAKKSEFLRAYNHDAYKYPKLHIYIADAMKFLRENNKKYDLILWDLPGLKHDKLLPLYSKEFYALIKSAMKPNALAVSWYYPEDMYPEHAQILNATLKAAGFKKRFNYLAYNPLPNGQVQETEQFFILTKNESFTPMPDFEKTPYLKQFAERFANSTWEIIDADEESRSNSIFAPNYNMLIRTPIVKHI